MIPYRLIGDIIVVAVFVIAFWTAETNGKIILITVMTLLFILPALFSFFAQFGILFFVGRVIFGLVCFLYIKWKNV